ELAGLSANTITKILARQHGVDKRTLVNLFMAFNLELSPLDYSKVNPDFEDSTIRKQIDWGEAVDVSVFYGREDELAVLKEWIIDQNCRVVALLGMGGIGKTSLAAKLVQDIQMEFDYIIWRSLYNSPPLFELLTGLIQFFSNEQVMAPEPPKSIDGTILQVINCLQKHQCLIHLDNVETILQSGAIAGCYAEGYEGYGQFIQRLGEISHHSCLLLTSREKPKDVALLEGLALPIRVLQLKGLSKDEGKKIFQLKGLGGEDSKQGELIERYCGNPLALKIVATTIQDVFDGNISEFLKQKTFIFGHIQAVFEKQFQRLSELERDIIYWLAINQDSMNLQELQQDFISPVRPQKLLEAIESLVRRSLIDRSGQTLSDKNSIYFKLHPLLMEYVTSKLIKQLSQEIASRRILLL
ncbi:NB-ARC domain-containing protein, partial [Aetokthonos hydrillicola]|uniref:NB-ARC domain-containing protein n=1 Tax=Aetokthonos hydrillicola TaxID=1550245 RepID=UPI001FB9515F